jgi:hypothetical protein
MAKIDMFYGRVNAFWETGHPLIKIKSIPWAYCGNNVLTVKEKAKKLLYLLYTSFKLVDFL